MPKFVKKALASSLSSDLFYALNLLFQYQVHIVTSNKYLWLIFGTDMDGRLALLRMDTCRNCAFSV